MATPEAPISLRIQPLGQPPFTLSVSPSSLLSDLRSAIAERLGGGRIRLLFAGRQLQRGTLHASGLRDGSALTVLRTAESDVALVRSLREDRLLRPFAAPAPKYVGAPRASARPPSLFGDVEALAQFADWRAAERILTDLAEDGGFYAAMAARGWRVGKLAEMYPAGRVGVDPVCVLGYNVNKGEEIRLRLRTDDLQGFRDTRSIRQTLAHELAHIVHSDHDDQFKELMLQVEREADAKNWRNSRGRVVGSAAAAAAAGRVPGAFPARPRAAPDPYAASAHGSRLVREAEARKRDAQRKAREAAANEAAHAVHTGDSAHAHAHADGCAVCAAAGDASMPEAGMAERGKGAASAGDAPEPSAGTEDTVMVAAGDAGPEENAPPESPAPASPRGAINEAPPVVASDRPISSTPAAEAANEVEKPKPPAKTSPQVESLLAMGFPRGLATLALRESGNEALRAANWIFSNTSSDANISTANESADDNVRRMCEALERLQKETTTSEQLGITLDTLHFYISNILRNPNNVRYREINGNNLLFRRRVAQFEAALFILKMTGFQPQDRRNVWTIASSPDMAKLWMAKSIIQERLIKELQK